LGRYVNYTIWETLNGRKMACVCDRSDVRRCTLRIGSATGGCGIVTMVAVDTPRSVSWAVRDFGAPSISGLAAKVYLPD
jgi:hypothetical protein